MMKRGHDVESAPGSGDGGQPWNTMQGSTCHWNGRAVCVAEAQGKIVKEAKILSEPAALVAFFEVVLL